MSATSMAIISVLTDGARLPLSATLSSSMRSDLDVLCELKPLPMLLKSVLAAVMCKLVELELDKPLLSANELNFFSISPKSHVFVRSIVSRSKLIRALEPLLRKMPTVLEAFFLRYLMI